MRPSKGKKEHGPRTNRGITSREVRLVGADGEMVGVVSLDTALDAAKAAKLDLVEVSPNAEPPVCKILDYGRFKYEQKVKAKEAKKKQKIAQLKEIKLRPNIGDHDLMIKLNAVRKFLDAGDKVKFTLRFRGREMAHQEIGMHLFVKIKEELGDTIKIDTEPSRDGKQVLMLVSPSGK